MLEHEASERLLEVTRAHGKRAAHDRRDLLPLAHRHHRTRVERPSALHLFGEESTRVADQRDVTLVARLRVGTERDQAVLLEHEPFHERIPLEDLGGGFREREARHRPGNPADPSAEERAHTGFSVWLVREREDRIRV